MIGVVLSCELLVAMRDQNFGFFSRLESASRNLEHDGQTHGRAHVLKATMDISESGRRHVGRLATCK